MYNKLILVLALVPFIISCASKPKGVFDLNTAKKAPDYSLEKYWSALPFMQDQADKTPEGLFDNQSTAKADVFYLHPTIYYGKKDYDQWNAPIDLEKLNDDVDKSATLYQATAFNGAGKVYAPRYRQAHINAYFHKDSLSARKAFELAYKDVKAAFEYYLEHYNKGRPIIIASHSQGTTHASRLMKEYFDGKSLQDQLVVAYLVGIPVDLDQYKHLKACQSATEVSCLTGWRTFKRGANPDFLDIEKDFNVLISNPLSWTTDQQRVLPFENPGTVLLDFDAQPKRGLIGAQIYKSILWSEKPKFRGSFFMTTKNFHRGDINLYYTSIRNNAKDRVEAFLNK